jgi:hypothetical protein
MVEDEKSPDMHGGIGVKARELRLQLFYPNKKEEGTCM